jgi:hypothetical protein
MKISLKIDGIKIQQNNKEYSIDKEYSIQPPKKIVQLVHFLFQKEVETQYFASLQSGIIQYQQ